MGSLCLQTVKIHFQLLTKKQQKNETKKTRPWNRLTPFKKDWLGYFWKIRPICTNTCFTRGFYENNHILVYCKVNVRCQQSRGSLLLLALQNWLHPGQKVWGEPCVPWPWLVSGLASLSQSDRMQYKNQNTVSSIELYYTRVFLACSYFLFASLEISYIEDKL